MSWDDWHSWKEVPFASLQGLTITKLTGVKNGSSEALIETSEGRRFRMTHHQDCCESVDLQDLVGDPADIVGSPVLLAEAVSSSASASEACDSGTWTFYKLATLEGACTLRWLGTSNGYSEDVSFEEWKPLP